MRSKNESRRKYRTEQISVEKVVDLLSPYFEIWKEVDAVGIEGDPFKIDAVCKCKKYGWYIGLEVKRSHLYMKEFAPALRQAIHYRFARIRDDRISELEGKHLPAMALFPDWLGEHDEDDISYAKEAEGMRLLAAQLRVGTFRENPDGTASLIKGQGAIWHSKSGWNGNAEGWLFGKRGLAATRRKDV